MVLEYFESDSLIEPNVDCCDVCAMEIMLLKNRKKELALVIKAIEELGKRGEKKIAQFIRGGNLAWIHEISDFNPQDPQSSYGKSPQELSLGYRVPSLDKLMLLDTSIPGKKGKYLYLLRSVS